jgi:hypothetical protein
MSTLQSLVLNWIFLFGLKSMKSFQDLNYFSASELMQLLIEFLKVQDSQEFKKKVRIVNGESGEIIQSNTPFSIQNDLKKIFIFC